jgi:hypothetical protein
MASYTTPETYSTPEGVSTESSVVPGNPTGPVSMSDITQSFLGYGDIQPASPYSISSYFPNTIASNRNYAISGGSINTNTRVLRYGYGIQKGPNYTQSIPNSGPISWGNFKGTFQQLRMRNPLLITAANNFEPPFQTYAQYDIVQYQFTGQPQTFQFYNARVIMIECWGANGRHFNGSTDINTSGGYSAGVYVAPAGGELYVYVGGTPSRSTFNGFVPGGWNGGGVGWQAVTEFVYNGDNYSGNGRRGAGGGASDVRSVKVDTVEPVLLYTEDYATGSLNTTYWDNINTRNSLDNRIIVAGGGGGGTVLNNVSADGGVGGGTSGGIAGSFPGNPGTSSNGGTTVSNLGYNGGKGYGGSSFGLYTTTGFATISGGGGGWYGGGAGLSGGGGSGYVLGMLPNTATGSQNFSITTVNAQLGQADYRSNPSAPNGLVRITIMG